MDRAVPVLFAIVGADGFSAEPEKAAVSRLRSVRDPSSRNLPESCCSNSFTALLHPGGILTILGTSSGGLVGGGTFVLCTIFGTELG